MINSLFNSKISSYFQNKLSVFSPEFRDLKVSGPSLIFFIIVIVISSFLNPNFFAFLWSNIADMLPLAFAALGATIVILSGEIDLSIGAAISLVNAVTVVAYGQPNITGGQALLIGFATGILTGLFNGIVVAYLRLKSLLATFATSFIYGGLALWLLPQPGGSFPAFFSVQYRSSLGFLPMPFILLLLAIIFWLFYRRHKAGQSSISVGGNAEAAFANGIPVARTKFRSFIVSGALIALSGLSLTCMIVSGDPNIGNPYTLQAITASVIGGASLYGGVGSGLGAIAGALILGFLKNIIFFLGIPSYYQEFVHGAIVISILVVISYVRFRGE